MSYGEFTLGELQKRFGLEIVEQTDLFAEIGALEPPARLRELLDDSLPLALDISTEKARSELVIAPLLLEVHRYFGRRNSFFSGIQFDVDPARGLSGYCDFLLSRSPQQLYIQAPVAVVTEAKNEDMKAGMGQCLAAMFAARVFNERNGTPVDEVFGAVTTGNAWRFLRLHDGAAEVDRREYYLPGQLAKVFGIFIHMLTNNDHTAAHEVVGESGGTR
jgi:hypothetical protein